MLTAVGGFTGSSTTASIEVLNGGVWLHRPEAGWLPMPRSALACAVLHTSEEEEEDSLNEDSEEEEEEEKDE